MSSTSWIERPSRREPPVERGDRPHAVAAPQRSMVEVGSALGESLAGGGPRASGATMTRAPVRCARQQSSMSSPWNEMLGSNPPSARNRSARTSTHADGSTNTSRTASCCSWSYSPGLDDRVDLTEAVETESDVLEQSRFVPLGQLGADDAGVGAEQLGDERADGVGRRGDVVVAQQEEAVVALDEPEHLVDRRSETDVRGERAHERRRDDRCGSARSSSATRRRPERRAGTTCGGWDSPGRRATRGSRRTSRPARARPSRTRPTARVGGPSPRWIEASGAVARPAVTHPVTPLRLRWRHRPGNVCYRSHHPVPPSGPSGACFCKR